MSTLQELGMPDFPAKQASHHHKGPRHPTEQG
jgi:hypothetical protein